MSHLDESDEDFALRIKIAREITMPQVGGNNRYEEIAKDRWLAGNGKTIPVTAMEESHLRHAIAKIERAGNWRTHWLPRLKMEIAVRRMIEERSLVTEERSFTKGWEKFLHSEK